MNVAAYIEKLSGYEEYAFTWEEVCENVNKSEAAIKSELSRLVEKKEIVSLRKGYYLILPPRYKAFGRLPVELFVDKLFKYLQKPYYLAFYTASKFHGAAHQQVQKDYVMTPVPAIWDINKKPILIDFFTATNWPEKNILQKRSDAGFFNISSPALTVADLLHYSSKLGGVNRMLSILEELMEEVVMDDLKEMLEWYPYKSVFQRMGYLMDELQVDEDLSRLLYGHLSKQTINSVLLNPKKGAKPGKTGNKWRVDVNVLLESDI